MNSPGESYGQARWEDAKSARADQQKPAYLSHSPSMELLFPRYCWVGSHHSVLKEMTINSPMKLLVTFTVSSSPATLFNMACHIHTDIVVPRFLPTPLLCLLHLNFHSTFKEYLTCLPHYIDNFMREGIFLLTTTSLAPRTVLGTKYTLSKCLLNEWKGYTKVEEWRERLCFGICLVVCHDAVSHGNACFSLCMSCSETNAVFMSARTTWGQMTYVLCTNLRPLKF